MHGTRESVEALLDGLMAGELPAAVEVVVCPAYVHLSQTLAHCAGSTIGVGVQDCSHMQSGAFTGEVSGDMVFDQGGSWVILGHSERRQYHAESDALVAAKLNAAIEAGLKPIVCVGETREQRESGEAEDVVGRQLRGALEEQNQLSGLVIAYEPVWAIGTGLTATPEQAQEMHAFIRLQLQNIDGLGGDTTRILYGGSVKPANAAQLFMKADIDGALVGGAALVAEDFLAIVEAAA